MSRLSNIQNQKARRANRVRSTSRNLSDRYRLSVVVSNTNIYTQIIDDTKGVTVASASSLKDKTGTMTDKAAKVGEAIAEAAKKAKVKQVTLDRGSSKYHGRVKALADAAREKGLEF